MTKTKIILVALAMALVVMAAIGVTYAQYANTQNQTNPYYGQIPEQGYAGTSGYLSPDGCYGYSQYPQGAYPYRMGMGMFGRFW